MGWQPALECVECKGLIKDVDYRRNGYVCPGCGRVSNHQFICDTATYGPIHVTRVSYLDILTPPYSRSKPDTQRLIRRGE